MKPRVTAIAIPAGPVRRHPGRPAKLAELAEPDRVRGAGWDRQPGAVFELLAVVEEHQVGKRFAKIAGRQEADILGEVFGKYPNSDLVLDAEDAASKQGVVAKHVVAAAQQGPLRCFDDEA